MSQALGPPASPAPVFFFQPRGSPASTGIPSHAGHLRVAHLLGVIACSPGSPHQRIASQTKWLLDLVISIEQKHAGEISSQKTRAVNQHAFHYTRTNAPAGLFDSAVPWGPCTAQTSAAQDAAEEELRRLQEGSRLTAEQHRHRVGLPRAASRALLSVSWPPVFPWKGRPVTNRITSLPACPFVVELSATATHTRASAPRNFPGGCA